MTIAGMLVRTRAARLVALLSVWFLGCGTSSLSAGADRGGVDPEESAGHHPCGAGQPRVEGPWVHAGTPDPDYTRDGCYSIQDSSVVRYGGDGEIIWTTPLSEDLGGVRPPHLLHDDERVYVADRGGITALDVEDGQIAWRSSKAPSDRMRLSGDLLLATTCGTGPSILESGRWLVARATSTGSEVFKVRLPLEVEDPLPIWEFGGLFVVQDRRMEAGRDTTLLLDREGHVRYRLAKHLVHGIRLGNDVVLLTDGEVVRLTSSGQPRWSTPSSSRGGGGEFIGGGIKVLAGGGLLEYEYGSIWDSGVWLMMLDPATGKQRWGARCEPLGVDHSRYYHAAAVDEENGQLKVTSRGSHGTFTEWLDPDSGRQIRRVAGR